MNPNKNFQQQQQAQMRRRQEQLRQKQMGAAWMEQQKAKAAQGAGPAGDPFTQLEGFVSYLRREYAAKRVTKDQAEAQLRENIMDDGKGGSWTVGFETGAWYRLTDGKWVKTSRPYAAPAAPAPAPPAAAKPKSRPILGFLAFLLGCVLTFAAGTATGWFAFYVLELREPNDIIAAAIVWVIGFILSVRWGRKVAKG